MADQKLLDQIAIRRAKGVNESHIVTALVSEGWSAEDVNGALAIGKIQQGSFSAAKHSYVMQPTYKATSPSHGAGLFFEIIIVAILLISAPGAYGLITQVFLPATKGQPVALEDTAKGYELLRDVPSLIPVGEGSVRSGYVATKSKPPTSGTSSGSGSTPVTAPAPEPAASVQLSQSSPTAPSVDFSASSRSLAPGSTVVLSWRSDDATSCTGTGFDTAGITRASLRMTISESVKYTLTCKNAAGNTVRRLSVTARAPDPVPTPTPTPTPDPIPTPTPTPNPTPAPVTYTLTASAGPNGSISPTGVMTVNAAANQTYTISPSSGYQIATLSVDGASVTPVGTHTFSGISSNHTIAATFSLIPVTPPPTPTPTPGVVSTTAGLIAALKAAKGGDTITVAPGTYADFYIANLTFSSPVIVTSADTSHQAILTNFIMENIDGLTFRRLDFKVVTPAWVGYNVYSSKHITFDRVHMYGPPGAPDNQAEGIRFFDSSNIAFTNSEVEQLAHGVTVARSNHVTVSGNHIHHMNADTLDFANVTDAMISGNVLHDWYPTNGAHPDAIQFAGDSTDVTIRGNLVFRGDGQNSQGFFIADGTYSNFTIADNLIAGTGSSAIRPISVTDLTLTNNRLVTFTGGDPTYILVQYSDRVTSSNNISSSISYSNTTTNLTESNNIANAPTVTDQGAAAIQEWLGSHSSVASIYNSIAFAPTAKQSQLASVISAFTGGMQDIFSNLWQTILNIFNR